MREPTMTIIEQARKLMTFYASRAADYGAGTGETGDYVRATIVSIAEDGGIPE